MFGFFMMMVGYFISNFLYSLDPSVLENRRIQALDASDSDLPYSLSLLHLPASLLRQTLFLPTLVSNLTTEKSSFVVPTPFLPTMRGTDPHLVDPHTSDIHYAWDLYNRTDINHSLFKQFIHYLAYTNAAYLLSLGPRICSQNILIQDCCGGNFGSTLMRLAAAIKMAMLLNRTMIVEVHIIDNDEYEFLDIPFLTRIQLSKLYLKYGCDTVGSNKEFGHVIKLPYEHQLVRRIYEETNNMTMEYPPLCFDSSILEKQKEANSYWWIYLRCGDIKLLPAYLWIEVGDLFQFFQFLLWNPSYLTSPLMDGVIPSKINMHKEIFFFFMRPNQGIRKIIQQFTQGKGFDYIMHFRTARDYHVFPFIERLTTVMETPDHMLQLRAKETGVPLYGEPNVPLRILVASSQYPNDQLCEMITKNVSTIQLKYSSLLSIDCIWFDAKKHVEQYGLDNSLSLNQVNFSPQDWGIHPAWAALVEIFSSYPLKFGVFGLVESSFSALFRLVSGRDSFDANGKQNNYEHFWPF